MPKCAASFQRALLSAACARCPARRRDRERPGRRAAVQRRRRLGLFRRRRCRRRRSCPTRRPTIAPKPSSRAPLPRKDRVGTGSSRGRARRCRRGRRRAPASRIRERRPSGQTRWTCRCRPIRPRRRRCPSASGRVRTPGRVPASAGVPVVVVCDRKSVSFSAVESRAVGEASRERNEKTTTGGVLGFFDVRPIHLSQFSTVFGD